MHLSEIKAEEWPEIAKYIDTLFLPIVPLIVDKVDSSWLDKITCEQTFSDVDRSLKGRLLYLPAIYYIGAKQEVFLSYLLEIIEQFSQTNFRYLCLAYVGNVSDFLPLPKLECNDDFKLFSVYLNISDEAKQQENSQAIVQKICAAWEA